MRTTACITTARDPSTNLANPPPIILPYFGVVRIVNRTIKPRSILAEDMKTPKTVALHPPPPVPTIPQVQDDFYALNMENQNPFEPTFGGPNPINWDFNVTVGPAAVAAAGGAQAGLSMDIDSWSAVFPVRMLLI
jgi:hypothetical protein